VEKENKADLQSMYKLLGSILDDPAAVSQLLKSRTYKEFSEIFRKKTIR
jgi:lichenan operon transcriptional antiterminator